MSKQRVIITLALLFCFVAATLGCDFQKPALPKAKVVRKKISAPKLPTAIARKSAQNEAPGATAANSGKNARQSPVAKTISPTELRPKSDIAATPASKKSSGMIARNSPEQTSRTIRTSQPQANRPPDVAVNNAKPAIIAKPVSTLEVKGIPAGAIRPKSSPVATAAPNRPAAEVVPSAVAVIQPASAPPPPEPDAGVSTGSDVTAAVVTPTNKKIAATAALQEGGTPAPYNPQGRINPFEPLFKDEPEAAPVVAKKKRRVPRTPLERIDLGQLKLVGIIMASSGNRALVQEASGKGYIIKEGTFIGLRSGKVTEIKKDRVVIEEETDEVVGTQEMRNKELVLPKPPGE
jgi:type IV pilus assembly protein PilP